MNWSGGRNAVQLSLPLSEGEAFHRGREQTALLEHSIVTVFKDKSCLFCSPALQGRGKVPFVLRGDD